nr:AraC family transcriptional regulator [Pseudomonas sp. PS02290]
MNPTKRPPHPLPSEPVRRVEAGPWMIELLPAAGYATRYVATQAAIGFAFESQRGLHAIGSDRVQPFDAVPNGLAFVPAGCDVLSESPAGGEYLRLLRTDGLALKGDHAFNNRIDAQSITLAMRMRAALLQRSAADDWEGWALALAERAENKSGFDAPLQGSINGSRMRRLDEFIDAGIDGPLGVQAMAQMLGLSEGYFIRAFKHTTGKSPHSYLIDRRLAKARALMRDSSARLAEIAHACGFSSQAHMATAFRLRMGISPAKLRNQSSL